MDDWSCTFHTSPVPLEPELGSRVGNAFFFCCTILELLLEIVNIYPVDKKEAIIKFDTKENVKTQSYTSERAVQQAYPFDGYPSFYLIDKKGIVAQSYNGFYRDLEAELVEKIESLKK